MEKETQQVHLSLVRIPFVIYDRILHCLICEHDKVCNNWLADFHPLLSNTQLQYFTMRVIGHKNASGGSPSPVCSSRYVVIDIFLIMCTHIQLDLKHLLLQTIDVNFMQVT